MPHIGPFELVIVLVIVMVIFGVGRLPEIGGAVGKAIREFRSSQKGELEEAGTEPRLEQGAPAETGAAKEK
jgi:sec-independent protein translocase protein TatA